MQKARCQAPASQSLEDPHPHLCFCTLGRCPSTVFPPIAAISPAAFLSAAPLQGSTNHQSDGSPELDWQRSVCVGDRSRSTLCQREHLHKTTVKNSTSWQTNHKITIPLVNRPPLTLMRRRTSSFQIPVPPTLPSASQSGSLLRKGTCSIHREAHISRQPAAPYTQEQNPAERGGATIVRHDQLITTEGGMPTICCPCLLDATSLPIFITMHCWNQEVDRQF
ncbi:hypothetical protein K470DRAFT_287509 [Piedraia hortae CBS 480.64]|uniref:Uncharacterized protein n=1 Tax=Piedraia hortae CBS 480.64 TaxID=1314780 RepID=A0A6A7BXE4_9PEZI|nr:hypothetical protein K470DRAFT_287509 [Piedraia hortae CBS 480.64]